MEISDELNLSKIVKILAILFLTNCSNPANKVDIDQAVEIICPGAPRTLVLRVSKDELREALRKQFTNDGVRETILKLKDGSNVAIPVARPRDLNQCIVRSLKNVAIPSSMGY